MAEAQVTQLPQSNTKLGFNQSIVQGKIISKRKMKTQQGILHFALLRLAAPDAYSHPATIEIASADPFDEVDTTFQGRIQLGGTPNNYDVTETDSEGNKRTVTLRSARNQNTVIPE